MSNWGIFQNPGRCNCSASAGFTVTCKGCNSILFTAGQAIQTWNHSGGTLLATYTTNSSGQVTIPAGTYWIIPGNGRFAGQNVTISASVTYTFTAATGYICGQAGCALWFPFQPTLYWTDSDVTLEPITVTGAGGQVSYSQNTSIARCDTSSNCNTSVNGNPLLTLSISCAFISRTWLVNQLNTTYDVTGTFCRSFTTTGAMDSATGFTNATNPPFAFSGVLSTSGGSTALPDPVGGTVTISE